MKKDRHRTFATLASYEVRAPRYLALRQRVNRSIKLNPATELPTLYGQPKEELPTNPEKFVKISQGIHLWVTFTFRNSVKFSVWEFTPPHLHRPHTSAPMGMKFGVGSGPGLLTPNLPPSMQRVAPAGRKPL